MGKTSKDLFQLGQKLRDNGNIDRAISSYQKAREVALQENNKRLASECLHMIGVAFYQDKKYQEAEKYLLDSINEFKTQKNEEFIGIVLRDLASVNPRLDKKSDTRRHYLKSIKLLSKNKGHRGISKAKLGMFYLKLTDFENAEKWIKAGIKDLEDSTEWFFLSSAYLYLAQVYATKSLALLDKHAPKDEFLLRRKELQKILE
jgi:tetratricopeptide (TPR) repeat protein